MQTDYTGHITSPEWRWVVLVGISLVLLAFVPFLWIAVSGTAGSQWQFMGMLHHPVAGASYLSKILEGSKGAWLVHFQHTPEAHSAIFLHSIYPALGQLARSLLPPVVMFHVARVGAALFMYMTLYHLAATIWMRVRTRRIFFLLASLGAGFGWLYAPLAGDATVLDLSLPEAFPFQSTLVNVHFPLALACLTLLASVMITAFRPGMDQGPGVNNGGLMAALISVLLAFVLPEAFVPLTGALLGYLILLWIKERILAGRLVRWALAVLLPPLPVLVIYVLFLMYNPAMVEWNRQNAAVAPSLFLLIIGLGLPLLIAFPSIYRTIRRFEPDGSQYMGVWLLAMVITVYLPTGAHTRFAAGIMIPIAYFGTRSVEDFWFGFVRGRWRFRLLTAALPLMAASQILVLITPLFPIFEGKPQELSNLLLERDYRDVFDWLEVNTRPTDIVLAAPTVGVWLPAWAGVRTVYGHPAETLDAGIKRQAVVDWYRQDEDDPDACEPLLRGDYTFTRPYRVGYVLVGPQETALGVAACARSLNLVAVSGSVRIFSVAELPATESPQQP